MNSDEDKKTNSPILIEFKLAIRSSMKCGKCHYGSRIVDEKSKTRQNGSDSCQNSFGTGFEKSESEQEIKI